MAEYRKDEAKDWAREFLRGQWTTLMTVFTSDDEVDEEGMRANMRHVRSLGTRGGGCTWGMGEFSALTREERLKVYDIVSDEASGEWPIAAHVTHTSAKEMTALAEHAEGVGFDLLILAPPYMVTRTEDQVVEWTKLLADSTSLAIMFYNSPQFGIVMSAEGMRRICDIPNVVGVKEASFNRDLSIETHQLLGRNAIISTPDEWIFSKGRELGFEQQVMFANTSDWRFDRPDANHYVKFGRQGHDRGPRRRLLRHPHQGNQRDVRQVVAQGGAEVRRRTADLALQVLGRIDGHGRWTCPAAVVGPVG